MSGQGKPARELGEPRQDVGPYLLSLQKRFAAVQGERDAYRKFLETHRAALVEFCSSAVLSTMPLENQIEQIDGLLAYWDAKGV